VRGTGRRPAVLVVALVLVAWLVGVAAPPAGAHTGNGGSNFRTTFTDPGAACLHWSVAGADGFVSLRSDCPGTVVVLGYQDEPYLELSAGGVRENRNSPATYLNADARGNSPVPSTVDAGAAPDWQQRADRPEYRWHDHRTHWMSGLPPETGGRAAVVLDWTIPVELAGEGPGATAVRVAAAGELFYAPPLGPWVPLVLAGVPVVAVAVLAAAGGARPRRRAGDGEPTDVTVAQAVARPVAAFLAVVGLGTAALVADELRATMAAGRSPAVAATTVAVLVPLVALWAAVRGRRGDDGGVLFMVFGGVALSWGAGWVDRDLLSVSQLPGALPDLFVRVVVAGQLLAIVPPAVALWRRRPGARRALPPAGAELGQAHASRGQGGEQGARARPPAAARGWCATEKHFSLGGGLSAPRA